MPNSTSKRGPKSDAVWSNAIRKAVHDLTKDADGNKTKKINLLAQKVVGMALEGDMQAVKEVGERLDGKPVQAVKADIGGDLNVNIGGTDSGVL